MHNSRPKKKLMEVLEEAIKVHGYPQEISSALKVFFSSPYGSLIVVDKEAKIQFMDYRSESLFGLGHGDSKGLSITDLIPRSYFPKVLKSGFPEVGRVLFLGQKYSIGTILPLIEGGKVIGAMGYVVFDSPDEFFQKAKEAKEVISSPSPEEADVSGEDLYPNTYAFNDILGISRGIRDSIALAKKAAYLGVDLLISGESGTGKELFAQSIHSYASPGAPFIRINSPSIPTELAESELFGYEKGAFSGAKASGKQGKFELAQNGSVFIDEISSMSLSVQSKLLWVLQEREFERVGGTGTRNLNSRIMSATNEDLAKLVEKGLFREDLYFRITNLVLHIPPLRERREDIPAYISHYLKDINSRFGTHFESLSSEALDWCMDYEWPGNVRELKACLEHAVLTQWRGKEIAFGSLPPKPVSKFKRAFSLARKKDIRKNIINALKSTNGNKRQAARILGISRATLYKRLAEHGIEDVNIR